MLSLQGTCQWLDAINASFGSWSYNYCPVFLAACMYRYSDLVHFACVQIIIFFLPLSSFIPALLFYLKVIKNEK